MEKDFNYEKYNKHYTNVIDKLKNIYSINFKNLSFDRRAQILEIDTANSSITVGADTFVGGSADAGVGYTTSSSY